MVKGSVITEEMRKAIGAFRFQDFPPEDVTVWAIKRYAVATENPNPLYQDEEYARNSRWGGITAPPTFVEVFNPGCRAFREIVGNEERHTSLPFKMPFERVFFGNEDFEFFVPIRPGDAIYCKAVLGDIYEKQGGAGRLVFFQQDKEYHNQRGEMVARTKSGLASVESAPAASFGRPAVPDRPVKPATMAPEQVYFEDVAAGMAIPAMEKKITMTTICKWAGATGDVGRPHFDYEFIRSTYGVPNVIAHGPLNGAFLAQLVTNWIGSLGVLKRHSTQYRANVFPGDIITFQGKIARMWAEGDENLVECDTWSENQHGMKVSLGKSVVTLPSRPRGKTR